MWGLCALRHSLDAGEDEGEGLSDLNVLNGLNISGGSNGQPWLQSL
jgi:hypothetical protein